MVGQACREIGIPSGRPLVRDLAAEIEWAGSTMISVGDYASAAAAAGRMPVGAGDNVIDLPGIARVMAAYQDVKSQVGAIDFEDVLLAMIALIGDRPDIADAIRAQYRWFTVDEYQDITPAQDRLLSGWLGDRDDVCVVGDASQTIYSFAGASPDALGQFARRWPNATEVRLDRCYRCTPEIVAVANAVIARSGGPHGHRVAAGDRRVAALAAPRRCAPGDRRVRRRRRGGRDRRRPGHRAGRQRVRASRHRDPHAHQRRLGADRGGVRRGRHPLHHARGGAVLRPSRGP